MNEIFYRWVVMLSGKLGLWVFHTYRSIVAAGFFLLFPFRVVASTRFYRVLFPDKNLPYHLWCTWRQYLNFTTIFLDRFFLHETGDISYTSEGWEYLEAALKKKTGGIILMSHMGNWEVAAHLFKEKKPDIPLLLYMGAKHKEQMERIQKESLSQKGVKIIALDQDSDSPFDIIEGIKFLKSGGFVSITGDVIWHSKQRTISVRFLDHAADLPETPHVLSLLSGAPLFIFFAFRINEGLYHFSVTKPRYIRSASREDRKGAVRKSAQEYAHLLENAVREHPLEWYHFSPFLGKRLK
jgi:lauroyl/myristoyl acyltransferase